MESFVTLKKGIKQLQYQILVLFDMLIYVSAYIQFSVFSSGHHSMTLQTAFGLKELGHEVCIVNILENNNTWYDDCKELQKEFTVIQKTSITKKADILIDVLGCMSGEERAKLANHNILFIRVPPIMNEIEMTLYPAMTMKRSYDNINEIWTYDLFSKNDYNMLGLLGRCPVRVVPFFWSSKIIDSFVKEMQIAPWFATAAIATTAPIRVRIAETNVNSRSNCTIPLVICREFDKKYPDIINEVKISNGQQLNDRQFFKDNILAHIDIKAPKILEGRSRSAEWTMQPKTILLAHTRFTPIRWLYLDCAYMGIPIIHNCKLLKQLGDELDSFYYEDNSISGGAAAMKKCYDAINNSYFNEQRLQRTRFVLMNGLTILRPECKEKWQQGLQEVSHSSFISPSLSTIMSLVVPAPLTSEPEVKESADIFRIQFVGMWDQFVSDYNFFTLLMENYFKEKNINMKVVGCGTEYKNFDVNLRILGPFGSKDPVFLGPPTIFTTSENVPPVSDETCRQNNIKLQLGFTKGPGQLRLPLWMMSINWFGADNDRLVNPRVIPLEKCYQPSSKKTSDRDRFCAFIVTNPCNPVRNAALDLVNKVGHVDSAGRYRNNCGDALFAGLGGGGGEEKKVAFLENYRFSITYENSYGDGYVTEKIFHAKAAGCIPIYWGDSTAVAQDFDPAGFIDAKKMTDEELVAKLQHLESPAGAEERDRMATTPMFSKEKAEEIRVYIMNIAEKMYNYSNIPKKDIKEVCTITNSIENGAKTVRRYY